MFIKSSPCMVLTSTDQIPPCPYALPPVHPKASHFQPPQAVPSSWQTSPLSSAKFLHPRRLGLQAWTLSTSMETPQRPALGQEVAHEPKLPPGQGEEPRKRSYLMFSTNSREPIGRLKSSCVCWRRNVNTRELDNHSKLPHDIWLRR